MVLGDADRLQQAIGNLLDNASKYTPVGGSISLTLTAEGKEAVLRVGDNGPGVPSDKVEAIFDLFTQVNPTLARTSGGLGIGLSLVRRIVELHIGTVQARNGDTGAEFDGYEVARILRTRLGHHVQLVALTGYGQEADRRRSAEAGFDAHLVKPVVGQEVLRLISTS